MEFTTERESLLSELNLFSGVVQKPTDDMLSAFSNVTFSPIETGCEITAVGNDLAQRSSIDADSGGEGGLSLPLDPLANWLRACRGDTVVFKETEENWIQAECGTYTTRIPSRVGDAPQVDSPPETPLTAVGAELLAQLFRAGAYAFPASEDAVAQAGAQLEVEGDQVRVVSSDHSRLAYSSARTDVPGPAPAEDAERQTLGLTQKAISQVQLVARGDAGTVRIFQSDNHLFFELGKRLIVTSKLSDRLPDYAHVIPRDCPIFVRVNREHLLSATSAADPFAAGQFNRCKLELDSELIKFEVNSVRGEEFSSVDVLEHRGKTITLNVNLVHLLDFARSFDSEFATLEFQSPEKAFILRPSDGSGKDDDNFDHFCVGMPLV